MPVVCCVCEELPRPVPPPMWEEPERSLSTLGSALLSRLELWGPAVVVEEWPVAPTPVPVCEE